MQESNLDHGSYFNADPGMLGATSCPPDPANCFVGLNSPFKFRHAEQHAGAMPNSDSYGISQAMIRSQSAAGPAAVASNTVMQTYSQRPQRQTSSNRPSHLMVRGSSSPASAMPFASSTGRVPTRLSPAVATFPTQVQDPAMLGPNVGQAPSEYIANHSWYQMPMMANDFPISPACPSLINYDTEDEVSSPMTRQTSSATEMYFGVQMSRDTSSIAHNFYGQLPLRSQPKHLDLQPNLTLNFNASVPAPSPLSAEFRLDTQDQYQMMPMTPATMHSLSMERSQSNTSHNSASSQQSRNSPSTRNKEALARAIETGRSLALAPKPAISSITSVTSIPPKRKLVIPTETSLKKKSRPSKRPKKEKIMCDTKGCGKMFSGSHELQRHRNNTHRTSKRFIIREPVADPADKSKTPICYPKKSIADCEKCKRMTTYACDYNAASHLRRKHFKPKDTTNGREDQERGGKSGGAWPSMPELKKWIEVRYYDDEAEVAESDSDIKTVDGLTGIGASAEADSSVSPADMSSGGISVNTSDESFDMSGFVFDSSDDLPANHFSAFNIASGSAQFDAAGAIPSAPMMFSSEIPVTPQQPGFNIDFTSIRQAYN